MAGALGEGLSEFDYLVRSDDVTRQGALRFLDERIARIHRDPFEPILPVLEASSPVGECRKTTEEILRRLLDEELHPRAAAEAVRAFLLLRIVMHTGLRQNKAGGP